MTLARPALPAGEFTVIDVPELTTTDVPALAPKLPPVMGTSSMVGSEPAHAGLDVEIKGHAMSAAS